MKLFHRKTDSFAAAWLYVTLTITAMWAISILLTAGAPS